jgi:hypothetical protein
MPELREEQGNFPRLACIEPNNVADGITGSAASGGWLV